MSRISRALAAAATAVAAAAGLLIAPAGIASAYAAAPAGPAAGAAAGCSAWNGAQPVDPASYSPLYSIAAVSPCDAWAVGFQGDNPAVGQPLIEHWTGNSWATVPITGPGFLDAVSAVSASDIWAAGDNNSDGALILHYNGSGWTQTSSPHDGDGTLLLAVDGRTASDAWAGGETGQSAVMMRWDGTNWTPSSLPAAVTGNGSEILSVSADTAADAWAVAHTGPSGSTVLLHWNGSQWTSSTMTGSISSVTALSPTSAWAVGSSMVGGQYQTLTEHWDGSNWNVVPSPDPGGTGQTNVLGGVTATSGSDVWAVGRYGGNAQDIPFAMHWNGGSWTVISLPVSGVQATDANPVSVSAAAPGQAWVSGISGFNTTGDYSPFAVPVPVVPDVSGDTVSAATSALAAAGLTVSSTQNIITNCTPSIPSSTVASTDPAAGQQAPVGQAVTLTVCGVTVIIPTVTVPDVTGQLDASARNAITSAGLHVGTLTLVVSCTIPRGTVLSQSPDGGTQAPWGSSVDLTEATRSGSTAQVGPHFCTH